MFPNCWDTLVGDTEFSSTRLKPCGNSACSLIERTFRFAGVNARNWFFSVTEVDDHLPFLSPSRNFFIHRCTLLTFVLELPYTLSSINFYNWTSLFFKIRACRFNFYINCITLCNSQNIIAKWSRISITLQQGQPETALLIHNSD